MKKGLRMLLLTSLLVALPLMTSCSNDDASSNNSSNNSSINSEENNNSDSNSSSSEETLPEVPTVPTVSLSEAKTMALDITPSYEGEFSDELKVSLKGDVLCDYAISGTYHFMILADETGIFPIAVSGNSQATGKYMVGKKYSVIASLGSLRNVACGYVADKPTREGDATIDITSFAVSSSIDEIYNKAYDLVVDDNDANIDPTLVKFRATYAYKINENLMMVFDGTKHIILHGDRYVNNALQEGNVYDFYSFPSSFAGKKGAEFIKATFTNEVNSDYVNEIKASAVTKTIAELAKTEKYNDNKTMYPYIIKVHAYVKSYDASGKYHLAFVDNLSDNVKYSNVNKNPKAIYAKNHVVDDYDAIHSNLFPYLDLEEAHDFYFVVTDYQTSYHVFQAFVIDDLTAPLN